MKYQPKIRDRRSIRLPSFNYSDPRAYFVTLCTQDKYCLFGSVAARQIHLNDYGQIVNALWYRLPERFPDLTLDAFVVMPNHVHGVLCVRAIHPSTSLRAVSLSNRESPLLRRQMLLPKIIGYYKMNTAKSINEMRGIRGRAVWQRNYYEHIIRNQGELDKIREYIATNPLRWTFDRENPNAQRDSETESPWDYRGDS